MRLFTRCAAGHKVGGQGKTWNWKETRARAAEGTKKFSVWGLCCNREFGSALEKRDEVKPDDGQFPAFGAASFFSQAFGLRFQAKRLGGAIVIGEPHSTTGVGAALEMFHLAGSGVNAINASTAAATKSCFLVVGPIAGAQQSNSRRWCSQAFSGRVSWCRWLLSRYDDTAPSMVPRAFP